MTSNDAAADPPTTSWREQAVARSLDSARARAESRVQRFLDAAMDLMNNSATGKDFTVQEVVERSGQSLRSFYQYFGGKQELLLALFEESVRSTADLLREKVHQEHDPLERMHVFVVEYHRLCRPITKAKGKSVRNRPTPALAEFAQQLLTSNPAEAARAFAPLVRLFDEIYAECAVARVVRNDIHPASIAGIVLEAIMFNSFAWTIGSSAREARTGDPAEELWDVLVHGIGA